MNKQKLNINEKFSLIINELNNLKKESNEINDKKFRKLQTLLEYLQTTTNKKFENNSKKLKLLKETSNENAKILKENKYKISILKIQIQEIEKQLIELKKDNKNNKDDKDNKNNKDNNDN